MPIENVHPNQTLIRIEIAKQSCLVCSNYRSVHPVTKVSYCDDQNKTIFKDSGCSSWSLNKENKGNSNVQCKCS